MKWQRTEKKIKNNNIYLYINDQIISRRINDRTELYCTFLGLAAIDGITRSKIDVAIKSIKSVVGGGYCPPQHSGLDYYIKVEAENRDGDIVATTAKEKARVNEI